MKIIESREQGLLVLTVSESANDDEIDSQDQRETTAGTTGGWSPYEVWRTRVNRFRSFDPQAKKNT